MHFDRVTRDAFMPKTKHSRLPVGHYKFNILFFQQHVRPSLSHQLWVTSLCSTCRARLPRSNLIFISCCPKDTIIAEKLNLAMHCRISKYVYFPFTWCLFETSQQLLRTFEALNSQTFIIKTCWNLILAQETCLVMNWRQTVINSLCWSNEILPIP